MSKKWTATIMQILILQMRYKCIFPETRKESLNRVRDLITLMAALFHVTRDMYIVLQITPVPELLMYELIKLIDMITFVN